MKTKQATDYLIVSKAKAQLRTLSSSTTMAAQHLQATRTHKTLLLLRPQVL